jgi:hypothetical protein
MAIAKVFYNALNALFLCFLNGIAPTLPLAFAFAGLP